MLILLLLAIETAGLSADQGTQASKAAEVLQDAKVLIQTGQVLRARQLAEQVRNQDFPDASIQNELGKVTAWTWYPYYFCWINPMKR